MFAVIKSGGKQYKVALGTILKLEKIDAEKSSSVVFKEVLMVKNDTSFEMGSPFLKNVEVKGKILENKKGKKVIVFKKRRRHNSRRKNGHRQEFSMIRINKIFSKDGKVLAAAEKKVESVKKKVVTAKKEKK